MSRNITKLNGFNSRLREEATSQIDAVRETVGSFNSRLREEATRLMIKQKSFGLVSTHASVRRRLVYIQFITRL